jgi:flap endonuclease-1
MGVKNLMQLLNKNAKNSIVKKEWTSYNGYTIAIDANLYIYKFLYNNGNCVKNFFEQILYLWKNNVTPIYVFDGKPPIEKKETLIKRKEILFNMEKRINELENKRNYSTETNEIDDEIKKLQKRLIKPEIEDIDNVKRLMYLLGIDIYNSPCEGDFLIADLYKKGLVNACLTDDSDSLPNGCGVVLRNFTFRTNEITEIKLTDLLKELEFTHDQFIDLCILCGTDYMDSVKGIGSMTAYKLIKEHKNIENVINSDKNPIKLENIENYEKVRELFKVFDYNYEVTKGALDYDINIIEQFLKSNCKYRDNTMKNKIKKIMETLNTS